MSYELNADIHPAIISTFKKVKDSMGKDCISIEKWCSSDIYSYPEKMCSKAGDPKLYEISIPTHHHNIKTAKLSDMPFDWDHHTVTDITMFNILKWIFSSGYFQEAFIYFTLNTA